MRGRRGVTMIELIMIIAIGAVTIGGLVLFTHQLVLSEILSRDLVIATNLARLKMAETENMDFAALAVGNTNFADEALFPGFDVRREVTQVASGAGATLRRVDVVVVRDGESFANPLARLTTYRHSHVVFGDGA